MRAIIANRYGTADVLEQREVEKPTPKDNEVLVKVVASALNAADLEFLNGTFVVRILGPFKPKYKILGSDIAGRIERVGKDVKAYKTGDEIWGDLSEHGFGTLAEYVCVLEDGLRLKPAGMTFEQAAAVPTAAVVALQNLRGKRAIQPGQKVLINGAGGGVGTFAVQFAKFYGAEVTAVDSAEKLDMLSSLGARTHPAHRPKTMSRRRSSPDRLATAGATLRRRT